MLNKKDLKEAADLFGMTTSEMDLAYLSDELEVFQNLGTFIDMMVCSDDMFSMEDVLRNLVMNGTKGAMRDGSVEQYFLKSYSARKLQDERIVCLFA